MKHDCELDERLGLSHINLFPAGARQETCAVLDNPIECALAGASHLMSRAGLSKYRHFSPPRALSMAYGVVARYWIDKFRATYRHRIDRAAIAAGRPWTSNLSVNKNGHCRSRAKNGVT
jgi:hypothetical protein